MPISVIRTTRLLALSVLLSPLAATAQTSGSGFDLRKPIDVVADEAFFDDRSGRSEYRGNVEVTQENLSLSGDRLIIHSPERQPQRAVMHGSPAVLIVDDPVSPKRAEALEIDYHFASQRLDLKREAWVRSPQERAEGDQIEYSLADDTIRARGSEDGRRVRITIEPRSSE